MRKSLAGLLLFTAVLFGITSAGNIAVDENSSKSSCNSSETEEKYLYLRPGYTVSDTPRDTFWNTVDSMIKRGETSVQLWRNGVITDCSDWNTSSIVVPSSDTAMVVINRDGCDFQTPSYTKVNNPSAVDAQIHYTIGYARVWESGTKTYNGKLYYKNHGDSNWTCYPGGSKVSDNQSCPNTTVNYVDETKYHEGECINYHVFRCGDGLVNKPMGDATRYDNVTYNEECDPASPDWKNRTDGKSCNASCKIEYEASSCGSLNGTTAYNSNYSSPRLSESSAGLCGVGKVVAGSFSYNKTTGKYTWSCKNGNATAIACNAQDLWCGDGKVQSSYEACDPKDSTQAGWKEGSWKTCSSSCKIEDIPRTGPSCSSTYNKKTEYTSTSAAWLSSSDKLCDVGSLVSGSFDYSGTPRTFTWKCINDGLDTTCNAYQQWCGDGKKNGNEVCDPQDTTNKSGWGDGCSTSCDKATYNKGVCGSTYHTKKTYMSIDTDRLTQYTQGLCDKGTVTNFKKHTSSHIYTWQCDNHGNISDTCWADQEWCGDGVKNGTETCDDGSKNGTSSSSCSATCTAVSSVSCGTQNGGTKYFSSKQTSPWLTKTSNGMCAAGLTVGTPEIKGTDSHLEWTCSNANGSSTTCKAYQEWCGDGVKNGSETCDEGSKNGTSSSSCSATCTAVSSVSCGTQNGGTKYFSSRQTTPWLTRTSNGMCSAGTVGTPEIKGTDSHLEWTCSNANGLSTTCKAYQEWCGDEILQSDYEECDYNDKNETNWGNDGCDTSCAQKNEVVSECDENNTFHRKLRQNSGYIFADRFNAGSADRRLYGNPSVKFDEKMDYNRGANPTFSWTTELVNNDMKVPQGKDMLIVESSPEYIVKDHPVKRTTDNLYVEYTVSYANKKYTTTPSSSQLKTHKECVYYEISRCGDGVLDEDYGEECDPGSEGTKVMPDGRICNADCKLVTVVTPLCNSEYNGQRVNKLDEGSYLCREGAITGFNYDTSTYKWTWKCHNVAGEVECRAIKPYCGDGILDEGEQCDYNDKNHTNWGNGTCNKSCQLEYPKGTAVIEKTLENKIPVDHEGQALTWIVKVTASGGDISNFEIWDKMPIELDYVDYNFDSAHSQKGVTVTYDKQRSPVRSGNVNIHYWNTTGTLYNGNSIVIKVNTTVNTMPRTGEDILNIACVIKDNKELDCGEDKPPVKNGELEVIKTLISKDKYVTHTGQELEWSITVRAKKGNVKMESIKDKLPEELKYKEYTREYIPTGINVSEPTGTGGKEITWETTGTLNSGDYIELHVVTTVIKMPQKTVKNVACAKPQDGQEECNPGYTHDLRIIKYVWNNQNNKRDKAMTGKVGGTITYRIEFGNNGDESVRIKLKDYLPTGVRFISGTLVVGKQISTGGIGTGTFDMIYEGTGYKIDGVTINSYENIFLNKNEGGVLTIEGEILNDTKNTTNFACIFDENSENKDPIACSDAHHNIEPEKVMCSSNIPTTQQSKKICDGKSWITDEITCSSTGGVADIIEFLCDGTVQKSGTNISSLTGKCEFGPNAATHTVECRVNKSNTSVNNCTQKYVVTNGCGSSGGCFPAGTKVIMSDNTKKNIEDVQTGDIVLSYNTEKNINELSTVKQSIVHVDLQHEMYELTINGNVLKVTDVHPFYVRKSLSSKDYDWIEAQHLKVGDILLMNDGTLVTIEKINHYSNKETVYNLEVEGNHDYFVDMGYLVHNKDPKPNPDPGSYCDKHKDDPMCLFANPTCFNVNEGNVSIEMGEYLPFYLNVYKDDNQDTYSYYFVKEKDKDGECVSGSVDLGSLKCTYVIKGPAEGGGSQEVFTKTEDCLSSSMQSYKGSLKDWVDWQKENYEIDVRNDDAGVTYYPRIFTSKSKDWVIKDSKGDNIYGEYQFQISVSSFKQCREGEWKEVPHTTEAICQSNFVLTEPYTVQKTPSGNLTASTDTLKKFRRVDGFKPFSDFISEISTTQYNKNAAVQTAMNNFITKYKKLAVEVNIDNSKFLKKGGNSVKVSKVPGKDIYFVDGDITIKGGTTSITKAFTLVQINGDTTIDGNVGHNMMLLTTGNIRFHGNCKSNQTVKGIFYAGNMLYRDGVSKNLDPDVGEWCDKGGLYVKGVLIGNNFRGLMDKSRSHLENWFKADENQKGSEIMKGGSVVIEYSPSVFTKSTMPPGAEDFTTALSIYKQ